MLHMSLEPNLTAALIGGGLAHSGVIIGQIFTLISGRIQRRHDRDVRQRERLEKLAEAVGATLPWYTALGKCRTLEEIKLVPPAPEARKAAMLASLYFPSLAQPATDFATASRLVILSPWGLPWPSLPRTILKQRSCRMNHFICGLR
jgi:hypothetical protein